MGGDDMKDEVPSGPYIPPQYTYEQQLARFNAKMDRVLEVQAAQALDIAVIKSALPDITDHEGRLRTLEAWKNAIPITIALSVLATIAAIAKIVGHIGLFGI